MPNFIDTAKIWWPTKNKMTQGLDIQGGSHLVLRIDIESALKAETDRIAGEITRRGKDDGKVDIASVNVIDGERGQVEVKLANADQRAAAEKYINDFFFDPNHGPILSATGFADSTLKYEFNEAHVNALRTRLVDQSILIIRNRIDEFGVSEPSITAQGTGRILVQLPGVKDANEAKKLINTTAKLDFQIVKEFDPGKLQQLIVDAEKTGNFRLVERTAKGTLDTTTADPEDKREPLPYNQYIERLNAALKPQLPEKSVVYFEKAEAAETLEAGRIPRVLSTVDMVPGDLLTSAYVGFDNQFGVSRPAVMFRLDATGTREFGDMTTKHVGKQMAIVLDRVIKSAPNIQTPITQGSGQITMGNSNQEQVMKEATLISTALRAGALPARLELQEERTVGPTLGADAIRAGAIASVLAAVLVFVFMGFFYRSFGVVANFALAFNMLITMAVLSSLGATLTLPGVAGLALTLGISVDASVIIFERIKEEIRKGASLMGAIREGYAKAFSSILDANVTSVAVCVVLMYFGTGPVRGFAITLLTGLVITMFTAVFFTRTIFDTAVGRWGLNLGISWGLSPRAN
jgi:preprotein translocase subunit SecD